MEAKLKVTWERALQGPLEKVGLAASPSYSLSLASACRSPSSPSPASEVFPLMAEKPTKKARSQVHVSISVSLSCKSSQKSCHPACGKRVSSHSRDTLSPLPTSQFPPPPAAPAPIPSPPNPSSHRGSCTW